MQNLYLGIDIGGTNTAFGLVTADGEIVARGSIATRGHGAVENYVESLFRAVDRLRYEEARDSHISAIGIGAPAVNQNSGCIEGATELEWGPVVPIAQLVRERFGVPTRAANDANAAAAGERAFGAMRGVDNFIMLTLGTGVGSGIVCDGHLLAGTHGFAGELGHYLCGPGHDRMCGCGRRGCVQTYASASGVVATLREVLNETPDRPSTLRGVDPGLITPRLIFEHAEQGDETARRVFAITGRVLGEVSANFATFTSPEAIVLFGGVANAFKYMEPAMRKALDRDLLHIYRGQIRIVRSQLPGSDAAILGAAALAQSVQ